MDEEKQILDAAKALGLGELVPEIYRDMLQPAVRHVGDGLTTIAKAVKISLAPLEAGIWGYEQIKDWLSVRVTRIIADRKTKEIEPPPMSIAGPLVFQMIFAKDEPELREMYASLLSSAMDKNDCSPHPAFVTIIQQLNPDEAKILKHISTGGNDWDEIRILEADDSGSAAAFVYDEFSVWCDSKGLSFPEKSGSYLDNLIRLRILELNVNSESRQGEYTYGRDTTKFPLVYTSYSSGIQLTDFGRQFIDSCIEKKDPKSNE